MARRRTFSQEYKHEAVQLACSSDEPVSQVARELGISPNLLSRWCREAKARAARRSRVRADRKTKSWPI